MPAVPVTTRSGDSEKGKGEGWDLDDGVVEFSLCENTAMAH